MHIYVPANGIFDGPITNPLLALCILIEILSRTHTKGEKAVIVPNLALFGRFPSDGAACMAVKGLRGKKYVPDCCADIQMIFAACSACGSGSVFLVTLSP